MKDEEQLLIQKAKSGESGAFGQLYDKYLPAIYRFVFIKIGRKQDAEDISQQVFIKAWQNIGGYEFQGTPFSSWVYRIASNAVIDYYRTYKGDVNIDTVPEDHFSEMSDVAERIDSAINMKHLRVALMKLEPDQQNVLIMKFVDDLSNKEIAEALEKTEGAVRVIQHRALKQLKNHVDEQHKITT